MNSPWVHFWYSSRAIFFTTETTFDAVDVMRVFFVISKVPMDSWPYQLDHNLGLCRFLPHFPCSVLPDVAIHLHAILFHIAHFFVSCLISLE